MFAGVCGGAEPPPPALPPDHPVVMGVNLAGSALLNNQRVFCWTHEPFRRALVDLGARHVDMQLRPVSRAWARNAEDHWRED